VVINIHGGDGIFIYDCDDATLGFGIAAWVMKGLGLGWELDWAFSYWGWDVY
jgi:hypothetical protein